MATIKAIEGRSVHQIQSGQVIVDLCSVVKELVENSLDAGATSLEVRFKSQGLDAIEIQDNGSGIPNEDYESLALKHYTSKLATYNDLSSLATFGFRGEALSSLCALSTLTVVTARDGEAPKGTKLEFETSGKLARTSIAASPKGTSITVEGLFQKLPVRRRELEKNIKREYNKAIAVLSAYACVCTRTKFSVSNQAGKGKKTSVFSTKGNPTTKENISNVYGAKTIPALTPLDLVLELEPTAPGPALLDLHRQHPTGSTTVEIHGHISRPVHGEGRQTPDRQMFFVNSRPCGLPQIAKAFNEIYKSYNVTQSPFIFADLKMDTNAYDVNVSPDKRTIMLHDQQKLLGALKDSLVDLFESQEQTIPVSQFPPDKQSAFKPPSFVAQNSTARGDDRDRSIRSFARGSSGSPAAPPLQGTKSTEAEASSDESPSNSENSSRRRPRQTPEANEEDVGDVDHAKQHSQIRRDFNARIASQHSKHGGRADPQASIEEDVKDIEDEAGVSTMLDHHSPPHAVNLHQPLARDADHSQPSTAIHDGPEQTPLQNPAKKRRLNSPSSAQDKRPNAATSRFANSLRGFTAPGMEQSGVSRSSAPDDGSQSPELEQRSPDAYSQEAARTRQDPDWKKLAEAAPTSSDSDDSGDGDNDDGDDHIVDDGDGDVDGDVTEDRDGEEDDSASDSEYIDEDERKAQEEVRVNRLLSEAEQAAAVPAEASVRRAAAVLRRSAGQTVNLIKTQATSIDDIALGARRLRDVEEGQKRLATSDNADEPMSSSGITAEERLSLTISKSDFARMRVVGQFNLGFILAVREADSSQTNQSSNSPSQSDDLFIIDQHASDEIYNFHRLSATTELTPQPLVRPHQLELTAVEEETVIEHMSHSLAKNGFKIDVDLSGASPVGQRCRLLTLPTSRETVFDTRDLEELLVLLQDAPAPPSCSSPLTDANPAEPLQAMTAGARAIVRPGKVRRMLAMRACRSSIMVGKALTRRGMRTVVRHMGEMERPWNCPHGRPTMRHVCGLRTWSGWRDGGPAAWAHQEDEFALDDELADWDNGRTDWARFLERHGADAPD